MNTTIHNGCMMPDELSEKLYGMTIYTAIADSICIKCKRDREQIRMSKEETLEYQISALCPACFKAMFEGEYYEMHTIQGKP